MNTNFENQKTEIVRKIQEKTSSLKCPVCLKSEFTLAGGYFAHDLQEDLVTRHIGGKNIPVVPIVCKSCGFIMEFSAGVLGILPKEENK